MSVALAASVGTPTDLCTRIADRLAGVVGHTRFDRYFRDGAHLVLCAGRLVVEVPSVFYANWLSAHFAAPLRDAARAETGHDAMEVQWRVRPERFTGRDVPGVSGPASRQPGAIAPSGVANTVAQASPGVVVRRSRKRPGEHLRHSLDDFVVGPSNELAFAAASRLADPQDTPGFRVLVLHGPCGVGKTHLLQGVARRFPRQGGFKVRYLTAEVFTNEYIHAVRGGQLDRFRAHLRGLDLLCIDDIHFIAGKPGTQAEFLHTFDALSQAGSRIALASDEHPSRIEALPERLVSRCLAGMVVHIDRPDIALRERLLRRQAAQRGLELDDQAVEMVARACEGSVRDLVGALTRIEAVARLAPDAAAPGHPIPLAHVRRGLALLDRAAPNRPVRIGRVLEVVSETLGVDVAELRGSGRRKRTVLARSLAVYIARELTSLSYPEIARAFGRSSHSTMVTAHQRIARRLDDPCPCPELSDGACLPMRHVVDDLVRRVRTWRGA